MLKWVSCLEEKTYSPMVVNMVALSSCPGYQHARIWALQCNFLVSSFGVSTMERTVTQLGSQGAKTFAAPVVGTSAFSLKTSLKSEAKTGRERSAEGHYLQPVFWDLTIKEVTGRSFHPKAASRRRSRSWHRRHRTPGGQWQAAMGTEKLAVRGKVLLLSTPPLYP